MVLNIHLNPIEGYALEEQGHLHSFVAIQFKFLAIESDIEVDLYKELFELCIVAMEGI